MVTIIKISSMIRSWMSKWFAQRIFPKRKAVNSLLVVGVIDIKMTPRAIPIDQIAAMTVSSRCLYFWWIAPMIQPKSMATIRLPVRGEKNEDCV